METMAHLAPVVSSGTCCPHSHGLDIAKTVDILQVNNDNERPNEHYISLLFLGETVEEAVVVLCTQ